MGSCYKRLGEYNIFAWSISGNETCVAVNKGRLNIAFDVGFSPKEVTLCDHVFISHGHIDHIGALPQHARKRQLMKALPAKYYTPKSLVEPLKKVCELFAQMHGEGCESLYTLEIIGVEKGDKIHLNEKIYNQDIKNKLMNKNSSTISATSEQYICKLSIEIDSNYEVDVFNTEHRCDEGDSLGYLVKRKYSSLKEEYRDQSTEEIKRLKLDGVEISDLSYHPEIAYLGDTKFSVFLKPAHPNLLDCDIVITEMTYLDDPEKRLTVAHNYGHSHVAELHDNLHILNNISHLVLIHFSDRYDSRQIVRLVKSRIPHPMSRKVYCANFAKRTFEFGCDYH